MTGSDTSNPSGGITRPSDLWRLIWSVEGWKCVVVRINTTMQHHFVATVEEAEEIVLRGSGDGHDTYYATSTFQGNDHRTQANVHHIRCFWLDVDIGYRKPYASMAEAWGAVREFLRQSGLPDPLVVGSGGGIHLYWPLAEAITPDQWFPVARALKSACERLGFHVDPAPTANSAAILRPVGTRNHKYAGRPLVTCGEPVPRTTLSAFAACLGERPADASRAGAALAATDPLTASALAVYRKQPTSGEKVAAECAQMAHMRDTKGNIPEPLWYAGECVLGRCDDGPRLAHEWSTGHPNYTREETSRKFAHAKEHGPTTCARFMDLNPEGCRDCPHIGKISSPIQLGRETEMIMAPPAEPDGLPALPYPFSWNRIQMMVEIKKEDGKLEKRCMYRYPAIVAGFRKGESVGGRVLAIQHYLPHDGWSTEVVEMATVDRKTVMGKLIKVGINIQAQFHTHYFQYIQAAIDMIQDTRKQELEFDQFGWKEDGSFLVGNELYSPEGPAVIVGVSTEGEQRAAMMKPRGRYKDWAVAANAMFAPGFEAQAFSMLCSFAAPLMRFLRRTGGCIVHQVGASGTGKSMGLRAAWTVWGEQHAIDVNRIDTMNARYKEIAVLSNIPIIFDELRNRDPGVTKDFILSFTDGRDKNRLDRTGQLIKLKHGWSTIVISAANESLSQAVMTEGEHAQAARVLEFAATLPNDYDQAAGTKLEKLFDANRGQAGRMFVQGIVQPEPFDYCVEACQRWEQTYSGAIAKGSEHRFYSALLAAIRVAGDLLNHWHMLEFNVERYIDFGIKAAQANREGLLDAMPNFPRILQRFINSHWKQTIVMKEDASWSQDPVLRPQSDTLRVRIEQEEKRLYVDRQYMQDWCTENHVIFRDMESSLAAAGLIIDKAFNKNLGAGTAWSAGGFIRCWRINLGHRAIAQLELVHNADKRGAEQKSARFNEWDYE
jgi:Domain of unknown function (DUF927)